VLHELGDQRVGLLDRLTWRVDEAGLDVGPAGPEPLGILGGQQRAGGGCGGGAMVGGRLRRRCPGGRGRGLLVRSPVLDHGRAARALVGRELLATQLVVGGVAAGDVGRCGAVGRSRLGGLRGGEIGRAQVVATLVHRWASLRSSPSTSNNSENSDR
jgi:hypothetical protein